MGVSIHGQADVGVSRQGLCRFGMYAASREIRDECMPEAVEVRDLPGCILVLDSRRLQKKRKR